VIHNYAVSIMTLHNYNPCKREIHSWQGGFWSQST